MAALVSGCYVASSNRVGSVFGGEPVFGSGGLACAPNGTLLGVIPRDEPMLAFNLYPDEAAAACRLYPRYVRERG